MTLHMPFPTTLPSSCVAASVPNNVHINSRKRRRSESVSSSSIPIAIPTTCTSSSVAAATLVTPPPSPPGSLEIEATRAKYVESLIATTSRILETLWPTASQSSHPCSSTSQPRLTPLPHVITSLLRRSRTSCSTLHLSLLYLIRLRNAVCTQKHIRDRIRAFPSTLPSTQHSLKHHPLLCPRRAFLTSLVLAHKYLNDKCLSNVAWGRISGLGVGEINCAEREFLICVGYEVGVKGTLAGGVVQAVGEAVVVGEDVVVPEVKVESAGSVTLPAVGVKPSLTLTPLSEVGSEVEAGQVTPLVSDVVEEDCGRKRARLV